MPELTRRLAPLLSTPVAVLDVGCSGGVSDRWRALGGKLRVVGADPVIAEIERLRDSEPLGEYVAAFIGDVLDVDTSDAGTAFVRSSARPATYNAWPSASVADCRLTLDTLAQRLGVVDFVKTDTDGGDLGVLLSGPQTIRGALGVSVETILNGGTHPQANGRTNIDIVLRSAGLSLYDETVHRYSRALLPDRFAYAMPAQTNRGQVVWADALYCRDDMTLAAERIVKLAIIFDVHGLQDCAAELVIRRPEAFAPYVAVAEALDILAAEWLPSFPSYEALRNAFDGDPSSFYPAG